MESPFWTTREVCEFFRVVRQTIDRWRRNRGFPEPGGHARGPCRFDKSKVLKWAEENGYL